MYRTTIMLPEDMKSRIVREANARGISLGEYVRVAVNAALDAADSSSADSLLTDDVTYAADAPRNASERHDDHIYGTGQ